MKLKNTLLAATLIAAPLSSQAQPANPPPVTGLYVSLGAGGNILMDEHLVNGNGTASDATLRSRIGPVVVVALGYGLGNGIRLELEGDYRNNRFSQGRDFGFPAAAGGNEVKYGPMFNALYDLTGLIPFPYAAPYAGVGVGYQWAHFDKVHAYGADGFPRFDFKRHPRRPCLSGNHRRRLTVSIPSWLRRPRSSIAFWVWPIEITMSRQLPRPVRQRRVS